jgi:hypothetical protein
MAVYGRKLEITSAGPFSIHAQDENEGESDEKNQRYASTPITEQFNLVAYVLLKCVNLGTGLVHLHAGLGMLRAKSAELLTGVSFLHCTFTQQHSH